MKMWFRSALPFLLPAILFWLLSPSPAVQAVVSGTTIAVTTTNDELNSDGDCSLREAVRAANLNSPVDGCPAGSGADLINVPAGTFNLSLAGDNEDGALTGDLDITDDVTIQGVSPAATIIRAVVADRVFHVQSGVRVTLASITIRDGQETTFGGGGLKAESASQVQITSSLIVSNTAPGGGGISNAGTMTITLSTIAGNDATPFTGGALITTPTGVTTLLNSTVRDNQGLGGGALSTFNGHIILIASTLSNNQATSATDGGGAIRAGGGNATIDVINSTVSGNSSAFGGGGIYAFTGAVVNMFNATIAGNSTAGSGGGLSAAMATVNMFNSVLAGNSGNSNPDCVATINSLGYNLIETVAAACVLTGSQTGLLTAVDPRLGPLQHNGGPTRTMALLLGSPATNGGAPGGCTSPAGQPLTTDQRGFSRPIDSRCDLGAYEGNYTVFLPLVTR